MATMKKTAARPVIKAAPKKMAKGGAKSNPLKTFNDNKAMAYKKAGSAMKSFKKSLPKAQDGKFTTRNLEQDSWGRYPDNKWYGYDPAKKEWSRESTGKDVTLYGDKNPKGLPTGKQVPGAILKTITNPSLNIFHREHYGNPGELRFTEVTPGNAGSITPSRWAKGGSTKAKKFAALAPPYNKATAADRIAGAKMKKAKFGAEVKVQRSAKAGKVRSASAQGYAAVGQTLH
jgi:hypothetical protein